MIREFWKEVREEEKEKKRLKKEAKKEHLTGEQKAYKVFGILLTIFVIFGSIFYTCSGSGDGDTDINWGDVFGISQETIEELYEPVDENLLLTNGKISDVDYLDFQNILRNAGVSETFFDDDYDGDFEDSDYYIQKNITLTDKQLGAYCNNMMKEFSESSIFDILDLTIVNGDSGCYMTAIAYCDLAKIIGNDDLPKVYLTTHTKVRLMGVDSALTITNGDVRINLLDEEANDEIVDKIDSLGNLKTYVNSATVDYIELLKDVLNASITLCNGGIEFKPLG